MAEQEVSYATRQPTYRKRVGRGGRIFIDRRGFHSREAGGKSKPRMQPESDASDEDEYTVDDMDDR